MKSAAGMVVSYVKYSSVHSVDNRMFQSQKGFKQCIPILCNSCMSVIIKNYVSVNMSDAFTIWYKPGHWHITGNDNNTHSDTPIIMIIKCIWIRQNCSKISPLTMVLTLNVRGPSYLHLTRSISWLLMLWPLTSPGHQQPWYWLCKIGRFLSYLRKDLNYLHRINVEKRHKM